ncbi:MAG: aldehyde dehydrogenase family protein [Acidimicrobiia bacterium]|nr:aldehyde dehydrogenase family protein [Acidimicrobiia bacterium]
MAPENHRFAQYIDGRFTEGSGAPLEVENPYTEKTITTVAQSGAADVEAAVAGARRSVDDGWGRMSRDDRRRVMTRMADALAARSDDLTDLQIAECGMFRRMCSYVNTSLPLQWWHDYADLAGREWDEPMRPVTWHTATGPKYASGWVYQEPVGVVSAIVPFNFPFFVATHKVAAALAAGCSVVLKLSELTPLACTLIAEAAADADLPAGALQYVIGGPEVGTAMVEHPDVDCVSFTGSTKVGSAIGARCGTDIKKVVLELGGKSAAIILDDANLDEAMIEIVGAFSHGGQGCALTTRLVVHEAVADDVVERLTAFARFLTPGDPAEPSTTHSPQITAAARDRVLGMIEAGSAAGAELVFGGGPISDQPSGHWVEPTLFDRCPTRARIAQEEIFGPVLVVHRVADDSEAVAVANDSDFGLWGAVFTQDIRRGLRVARGVRTGCMGINGEVVNNDAPFGGVKKSGVGREFGAYGVREFLEPKSVTWWK